MKLVTVKQNGKDWHKWRGQGIGASEAPAIMNESKWGTPFTVWGEKTGLVPREPFNAFQAAAVAKGQEKEPEVRAWYAAQVGLVLEPLAGEHDDYSFIRASFDAITLDYTHGAEIKYGSGAYQYAKKGKVPPYYLAQIQQQYAVSGAKTWDFVCGYDGEETKIIPVPRDDQYINEKLIPGLLVFWELVQTKTPPPCDIFEFKALQAKLANAEAVVSRLHTAVELATRARS